MTIRIIDNKKVDLTEDEYDLYKNIVQSYTTPTNRGEDLFIDLFESDDNGTIVFLRPPSKRQTSFEVFMFLMSIMTHQNIRLMQNDVYKLCGTLLEKVEELDEKINNLTIKP